MDRTRRRVPKSPQDQTISVVFIRNTPLCTFIAFRWRLTQVFMLHMTERVKTVSGSIGIPNMESCLNNVSRPPVVAVAVVAMSNRTICSGTWWNTSIPEYKINKTGVITVYRIIITIQSEALPSSMCKCSTKHFFIFLCFSNF